MGESCISAPVRAADAPEHPESTACHERVRKSPKNSPTACPRSARRIEIRPFPLPYSAAPEVPVGSRNVNPVPVRIKLGAVALIAGSTMVALLAGTDLIPSDTAAIAIVVLAPLAPVAFAMRAAPEPRVITAGVLLVALWAFGVISVAKLPAVVLDLNGRRVEVRVMEFMGTTEADGAGLDTYRIVDGEGEDVPGELTMMGPISFGTHMDVLADPWGLIDPVLAGQPAPGGGRWTAPMGGVLAGATATCLWLLRRAPGAKA